MLSYRHAFHAGNHADVLKHSVLSRIVINLGQKDKPFTYIDTHSGAGIYDLSAEWAQKTLEAESGILKLLQRKDIPELVHPYVEICKNLYEKTNSYPGSPEIVRALSRDTDQLTLMELHPADAEILKTHFSGDSRIHIHHRDGYVGLVSLSPPNPRRGLALIDPSYETADDYEKTISTILAVHRRWPVGIQILWYPLLPRRIHEVRTMKDKLASSGIQDILCAELYIEEITDSTPEFGLVGSGLIILQPPWKLKDELTIMLPYLANILSKNGKGSPHIEWLSEAK